jgi:hypothetical protein
MAGESAIINGHRYSFASIDLTANNRLFIGITRISYGSSLKPGIIRGTDSEKIGRTPGDADHRCEIEMLQREFNDLLQTLGPGFGLIPFDIQVAFAEPLRYEAASSKTAGPEGVTTHLIRGCRITDVDFSGQEGPEANKVRVTLDPITIVYGTAEIEGGENSEMTIDWRPDILPSNLRETR